MSATSTTVTVGDVITVLDGAYPPHLAEDWDAVGLICGDPADPVESVLLALDCTDAVAEEAIDRGVDLLVVHHPLLLRGVTSVAANTPKGRIIHRLTRAGIALFAAHTNADSARPGVNDVLARTLGVTPGEPLSLVEEAPSGEAQDNLGIGRVGELDTPMTLAEFTERVAERLPSTVWGVRAAGDPQHPIRRVAVASGAGDGFLDTVRELDVDCLVTSDLRHHPVDEHLRAGGCPVIDTAHWASEFPWCAAAAELIHAETGLPTAVSELRTDPWTVHAQ